MEELNKLKEELRCAVADYLRSEGCSCCEDTDRHQESLSRIGKLLDVPMYQDGSGYDFTPFRTEK